MVAVEDIEADEVLTRIPKSSCLEPRTTEIRELIAKSRSLFYLLFSPVYFLYIYF